MTCWLLCAQWQGRHSHPRRSWDVINSIVKRHCTCTDFIRFQWKNRENFHIELADTVLLWINISFLLGFWSDDNGSSTAKATSWQNQWMLQKFMVCLFFRNFSTCFSIFCLELYALNNHPPCEAPWLLRHFMVLSSFSPFLPVSFTEGLFLCCQF